MTATVNSSANGASGRGAPPPDSMWLVYLSWLPTAVRLVEAGVTPEQAERYLLGPHPLPDEHRHVMTREVWRLLGRLTDRWIKRKDLFCEAGLDPRLANIRRYRATFRALGKLGLIACRSGYGCRRTSRTQELIEFYRPVYRN